jgi:hypothetical protein
MDMNRQTTIETMKVSANDGRNVSDTTLLKPGAKDSLSGENSTVPFSGSVSVAKMKPFGGLNVES